jgi:hypothetical protein
LGGANVTIELGKGGKHGEVTKVTNTYRMVQPGDLIMLGGQGGKVESNTAYRITTNGSVQSGEFHTSCSQPLYLSDVFGGR